MSVYAEVVLSLPLDQTFSYTVPEHCQEKAKIGLRVLVPFHQRIITGFIVNLRKRRQTQKFELKEVIEILDEEPVFSTSFLSFTRKLSDYYYSSWGELLQVSLPPSFILKSQSQIFLSEDGKVALQNKSISEEEREVMSFLQKRAYSAFFLQRKFKDKNFSLLSRLEKKGWVYTKKDIKRVKRRTKIASPTYPTQLEMDFSLDLHSCHVINQVTRKIGKQIFSPFYLYGLSERREAVYFYLIKKILAEGRRVLFLVPEIAPTQALRGRLEKKLGERAALLHSRLSERHREFEWQKIKEGEADVVIGPRSALFSPLDHLGLIIVDEEQDDSYYQQESPCYDARKGAWLRAKQEGAILLYGSAFPSVEAFYRAKKRGHLLRLESEVKRKKVEVIDARLERRMISRKLEGKIGERLRRREPILVFYNRRGYAFFLFCSKCSNILRCIHCDIALNYHKREEKLICHYCNYTIPLIKECPECGSRMIKMRGVGIEAVVEELERIFPHSKVACFDADVIKGKGKQERILQNFQRGKIDILVGTQLLTHQLNLPSVSLVAILYPETILSFPNYRSSQRAFLTLNQMIRFLRKDNKAEAIIQTALPHHFSICQAASGSYISFFHQEIKFRRIMNYPPFSFIVEILFQGDNIRNVARKSREFSARVEKGVEGVEILGPALASVSKVRGINRVQVILKARKKKTLDEVLRESLKTVKLRKSVFVYE